MRIAVSGSHGTGKSTLIAAFLSAHPEYAHEPEAFEALADDIDMDASGGPTVEGLEQLLKLSLSTVGQYSRGASVIFERSPVDYLAYAAAGKHASSDVSVADFLSTAIPEVRAALRRLDLIVLLPVSARGLPPRGDESPRFRRRVHEALQRALVDDEYELFSDAPSPRVFELSPIPERHLDGLLQAFASLSKA